MKNFVYKALRNPLISGSAVIFLGTFVGNFFNFLFNFFMTRNLSVAEYGALASLVAIILLFALIAESFTPTIVHFSGSLFANNELNKVTGLFWRMNNFFVFFGATIIMISIIFNSQLSSFFKTNDSVSLLIVGCIVFFTFVLTLNKGILTGALSFGFISFLNFFSALVKFGSGVVFVMAGFGVVGGLLAFLVCYIAYYLISFIPLRFVFKKRKEKIDVDVKKLLSYSAPSSIAMLGITLFITIDLILVKHFYSPQEAGIYAGMSLLGKIIYFFSAPIATVLFPLVVQRHSKNEKHSHLFFISILLVLLPSICITTFYYLFPEFSIRLLLKQEEYLLIKPILWLFGIFMILYSLLSLVANYYLSMKKTMIFLPIVIGALFQSVALWFYHDTFITVIIISIISVTVPLCSILLYYWKTHGSFSTK